MGFVNVESIVEQELEALDYEVSKLVTPLGRPSLKIIQVGDNYASTKYVSNKIKTANQIGIEVELIKLPEQSTTNDVLKHCLTCKGGQGVIVQLPLPKHIDTQKIEKSIEFIHDADGFSPESLGDVMSNGKNAKLIPATPLGIMTILKSCNVQIEGKVAVILGRSNIVGKPIANLLINEGATVIVCNSKTENLEEYTKKADILVVAVGKPKMITPDMVKEGAFVVDVGINRGEDNKLCGDVHPDVASKAELTPVPRGVGLTTVASLMYNTVNIFKMNFNRKA